MSDPEMARTGSHRPIQGRRRAHRPTSLEGLPTAEDLVQQPHKGDDADRFSLYTPEQIEAETKDVKRAPEHESVAANALRVCFAIDPTNDSAAVWERLVRFVTAPVKLRAAVNDAVKITGSLAANGDWTYVMDGSPID